MPSIQVSQDDFNFLTTQAELEEVSLEEYLSFMVDRQRLIVKHQANPVEPVEPAPTSAPNLEAPHRKWGM